MEPALAMTLRTIRSEADYQRGRQGRGEYLDTVEFRLIAADEEIRRLRAKLEQIRTAVGPIEQDANTVRDWISANITMQTGMPGAKPEAFWLWLFAVLNLQPGDEFVDLFPGSGGGMRMWAKWQRQLGAA